MSFLADTEPAGLSVVAEQGALARCAYRLALGSSNDADGPLPSAEETRAWTCFADVILRFPHEAPPVLAPLGYDAFATCLRPIRRVPWSDLGPARAAYEAAAQAILAGLAQLKNRTEP